MADHQLAVVPERRPAMTQTGFTALDIARHMDGLMDLGRTLLKSGLLPDGLKSPEAVVAIILKGQELGEQPMYALSNIAIVNGKPSISAEMMLARIYKAYGKRAIRVKSSDDRQCTVEYRLDGWPDTSSYTFTIEEAQRAGVTSKQVWKAYPAAMLRARCVSAVARMAFPECIAGAYVPGELGDDVVVTGDNEVISVSAASVVDRDTGEIRDTTRPLPQRGQRPPAPSDRPQPSNPHATSGQATTGQGGGKAKHFRAKLADLMERTGWADADLDAVAVYDHKRPIDELSGDELEVTFRDLDDLARNDPDALRTLQQKVHESRQVITAASEVDQGTGGDRDPSPQQAQHEPTPIQREEGPPADQAATSPQINLINVLKRELGMDTQALDQTSLHIVGQLVDALSRKDASQLIEALRAKQDQMRRV